MNRYIKLIFGGVASLMMAMPLTGCNDIDRDFDEIVPEDYHTIVSLRQAGLQDVSMSVADGIYEYEIAVLKGGVDNEAVVDVMIDIPGQDYIDKYYNERTGTDYKVLPASMYSVADYHLKIRPGESGKSAVLMLDTKKIYAAMQQPENAGKDMVLPVRISSPGNKVNPNGEELMLRCDVSPVVVGMSVDRQKVGLPDNESAFTMQFVVEKRGDMDANVHFELFPQNEVDALFGSEENASYHALSLSMISMDRNAVIGAEEEYYSHSVAIDVDAVRAFCNEHPQAIPVVPLRMVSDDPNVKVDRPDMIVICTFHEYGITYIVDKSQWNVAYGTPAMTYGRYDFMFDGVSATDGWMTHILDGFSGSQNLGRPYVVVDLGSRCIVGEVSIEIGVSGWTDVNPIGAEFYITDEMELDPGLSNADWRLLECGAGNNNTDVMSDAYLELHQRLKQFDAEVAWEHCGTISKLDHSSQGVFKVSVPMNVLVKQIKSRYIKMVLLHSTPDDPLAANRVKVSELNVGRVSTIDGEPVD